MHSEQEGPRTALSGPNKQSQDKSSSRSSPRKTPSRAQLRKRIEAAAEREIERCRIAHGPSWPAHRDWLIDYLNASAREWLRTASSKGLL